MKALRLTFALFAVILVTACGATDATGPEPTKRSADEGVLGSPGFKP